MFYQAVNTWGLAASPPKDSVGSIVDIEAGPMPRSHGDGLPLSCFMQSRGILFKLSSFNLSVPHLLLECLPHQTQHVGQLVLLA